MEGPLKKNVTVTERRGTAKTGRTPAKLRVKPMTARAEPAAAARISLPSEAKSLMPSAAMIGMGLLLESELLVGIAIGTGIVIASRWLPEAVGDTVQPVVKSTVKACYSAAAKTSQMLGEAVQRVESIITRQAPREKEAAAPSESERNAEGDQPQTEVVSDSKV